LQPGLNCLLVLLQDLTLGRAVEAATLDVKEDVNFPRLKSAASQASVEEFTHKSSELSEDGVDVRTLRHTLAFPDLG